MRLTFLALVFASAGTACAGSAADDPDDGWDVLDGAKADDPSGSSYGALAAERTPKAFSTMNMSLGGFGAETLPHDAKLLRKQIGEARDYVDLFSFAYSKSGPGDPWKDLRAELDEGYEKVGAFKD